MFSFSVLLLSLLCLCRTEDVNFPGNITEVLTLKRGPNSSWLPANPSTIDEAPYLAAVIATDTTNNTNIFLCNGVLISTQYVLSESHFMDVSVSRDFLISVVLGASELSPNVVGVPVTATIKYRSLALLQLSTPVNIIKGQIETVKLAKPIGKGLPEREYIKTEAKLSGWNMGARTVLTEARGLYSSQHWVSSSSSCRQWMKTNLYDILQNVVCTSPGTYDKCIGSTGSPLVGPRKCGGELVLIGLARYNMQSCRINPIIFDFIPSYYSWIERELGITIG